MQTTEKIEKQKCPCHEKHCNVITRFLQHVELSLCKTNTRQLFGYNTIHYKTQSLVDILSNDLKSGKKNKRKRRRGITPLSCKGVLQVCRCVRFKINVLNN